MDFKTFQKSIDLLKSWREKGHKNFEFPDSRDPDFQTLMADSGVVPQDFEKSLIALCAWREGRQDVYVGQSAIVHVIRNRQKQGQFRSHLTSDPQFASMSIEGDSRLDEYPDDPEDQNFNQILSNLDDILAAKTVDLTQGSTAFGVIDSNMPEWFKVIADSPDWIRKTKIGNVTFFGPKEVK
jgi:hypothetical protein